jgi:hypothetical protein
MNAVYLADVKGVAKWCCAYMAGHMPAPGFHYFDTRVEAENCLIRVFASAMHDKLIEIEPDQLESLWTRITNIGEENIYFLFQDDQEKIRPGFCKVDGWKWGETLKPGGKNGAIQG